MARQRKPERATARLARHPVLRGFWALLRPVRRALGIVQRPGWVLVATVIGLVVLSRVLGWVELLAAALALGVLVIASIVYVIGGSSPNLTLALAPKRLTPRRTASDTVPESTCSITASNPTKRFMLPMTVELPVGDNVGQFGFRGLGPGKERYVDFQIPGVRRGVIVIGPAMTVRRDPFGLTRRVISKAAPIELYVHPRVTRIPPLDAGMVRDLEGRATTDPSDADLDFHTLRPYSPGDDRRHIHWLSSARATAASGATTLMTRTYNDTRRSHLGIVVDGRLGSYGGDRDTFEAAVAAAASVATRAFLDEIDVTVVASDEATDNEGLLRTLDGFARIEPSEHDLSLLANRLLALAPSTSIVLLVTGSDNPFSELRRARTLFPGSVRVVGLRVKLGDRSKTASLQEMSVLSLGNPDDLPRLVAAGVI